MIAKNRQGGSHKQPTIYLSTGMVKTSKEKAEYSNFSRIERCESCVMFIPTDGVSRNGISEEPTGECTKVRGTISPVGHCRFWSKG